MEIIIRAAEIEDAEHCQRIFGQKSVYPNTMQRPCPSLETWRERLKKNKTIGILDFVAEIEGNVVGTIGIFTFENPRRKHVVSFGIGIDENHFGKGVGSKLLEFVIDYAFNWLGTIRIELDVFVDNDRAIALYKKFGFEEEGISRLQALRNGQYCDVLVMALLNDRFKQFS
ncbi:GNAT family N-acetyltransferase [Xenorhabdus sp. 12]|uniref:GNAT family N-acetyltransferase n=1 Tax=Xenorhabdus santafensis TaxID=2582833 RepID=A0ABU4SF31_9GAMM|nr:GNAT family N-acetyltransferase [Xenorhabdus sp. 12]MDX7989341.1 GNAT family N-acetyltransferase [Xenorhabdus sp. 12]